MKKLLILIFIVTFIFLSRSVACIQFKHMRILHHGEIGGKTFTVEEEVTPAVVESVYPKPWTGYQQYAWREVTPATWKQVFGPTADLDAAINFILNAHRLTPNMNYTTKIVYANNRWEVQEYVSGSLLYSSNDFVTALNWAITNRDSIYVPNPGFDIVGGGSITMRSNKTVVLENGVRVQASLSLSSVSNAHFLCANGMATLLNGYIGMNDAEQNSIRNLEIYNSGGTIMSIRRSRFNWFENIWGHRFRGFGINLDTSPSNKFIDVIIDGEDLAAPGVNLAVDGIFAGCEYYPGYSPICEGHGRYNIILRGRYQNTYGNNLYLCSSGMLGIDYFVLKDVHLTLLTKASSAGIKMRPLSHSIVVGLVSENNSGRGMELGSGYPGDVDRWSPDNVDNYIQGYFGSNGNVGIMVALDGPFDFRNNQLDVILEDNNYHGLEMNSNYGATEGGTWTNNNIKLQSRRNGKSGIWALSSSTKAPIENNIFTGIVENNEDYGVAFGSSTVRNNTFTGTIRNNGQDVYDMGTGNTINGVTATSTTTVVTSTSTTTTILADQVTISGQLRNSTGIIKANIIVYNKGTGIINNSQATSNGNYGLSVWPKNYDIQFNILEFFIQNFFIKLISFNVNSNLMDVVNYVNGYSAENKVSFRVNITGDQEIQTFSEQKPKVVKANGIQLTKASSLPVSTNEWFYDSSGKRLYMKVSPVSPTTTTLPGTTTTTTTTVLTTSTTIPVTTTTVPSGYIFEDGFESGDFSRWNVLYGGGTESIVSNPVFSGSYATKFEIFYNYRYAIKNIDTSYSKVYQRAYFLFSSPLPTTFGSIITNQDFDFNRNARIEIKNNAIRLHRWYPTETTTDYSFTMQPDTWYCLELEVYKHSSEGSYRVWLNGNKIIEETGLDTSGINNMRRQGFGVTGGGFQEPGAIYMDSVVIDDSYIGS